MYYFVKAEYKNEERDDILTRAIEMNKNNPKIWIELLNIYCNNPNSEMANKVFRDGVKSLESDSMSLWDIMENFLFNLDDDNMVK